MTYGYVIVGLWAAWAICWIASSVGVKPVERREGWQSRLTYSVPLWIAAVLLLDRHLPAPLTAHLFPISDGTAVLGAVLTAAGLGWAVWARVILGGNWSAEATVKQAHELVQAGPYTLSRHPIYTGLGLAFIGSAIAVGEVRGVLAAVIAIASFCYKLGIEERLMVETFGSTYESYRRRVKALVPFVI
jgi:protein-S-isoprenylcysteine O-methyltransferase Ste14